MALAQRIVECLRRIEQLKMERDGVGASEQVSAQAEIFRLFGVVQGILTSQGDPIWAELEPLGIVKQVLVEELEETWEQLKEMRIPKRTSGSGTGTKDHVLAEFPRYLELPGPVVRKMILSYLTDPNDELSVAKAIPSEVQFLSGPLNLIKLKAVFPILMEKKLLEPVDVMNLSAADPYIHGFIRKYFETGDTLWTLCKDTDNLRNSENYLALEHVPVTGNLVILPVVVIKKFNNATWNKLRTCGSQILHCSIQLERLEEDEEADQQQLQYWIKSYLQQLTNLRTLIIFVDYDFSSENPISATPPRKPILFPVMPFLKNMVLQLEMYSVLSRRLLAVYGAQLEMLHVSPVIQLNFPISFTCVSSLSLGYYYNGENRFSDMQIETMFDFMNTIADCPLKALNVEVYPYRDYTPERFQQLVALISNNWGESLECLQLNMGQFEEFTWTGITHNLGFPKLKQFTWANYLSFFKSWDFLFCCPYLEKLSFIATSLGQEVQRELRSLIEVYNDKERMLRSNIWIFFPNLEQVVFNKWMEGRPMHHRSRNFSVTRKESVAYQLQ